MSRPGFVLEVDERTPGLLVRSGDDFLLEPFPLGTNVVYPPDSLPGLRDVASVIDAALRAPQGSTPLPELLHAGMTLTIVFDDLSAPLPPMRAPDVRQRVIEAVLEMAASAGVDDVDLIAANGLRRRMTPGELKHVVGERVFGSFFPECLRNHDAEDRANITTIGTTEHGETITINSRVAQSDLVVHVSVAVPGDGGKPASLASGLACYDSIRQQHSAPVPAPAVADAMRPADALLAEAVRVFTVAATLNNDTATPRLAFFGRREWEWSLVDQGSYLAAKRAGDLAPAKLRRRLWHSSRAGYGVTGIHSGDPRAVLAPTMSDIHRQALTDVTGQSDVLVLGVGYLGPYNVASTMNPVLAANLALGRYFNSYRGKPIVREGGALIMYHPLPIEFHPVHHPSYIDFFDEVLSETTDPATIETKYEKQFAEDEWYRHLYRNSYAYHGVHPFYAWYDGAHALRQLGDVICVGADRGSASRLGFRTASTLLDALEMASDTVGRSPSISYLHSPDHTIANVT